jgi:hypothetical protein
MKTAVPQRQRVIHRPDPHPIELGKYVFPGSDLHDYLSRKREAVENAVQMLSTRATAVENKIVAHMGGKTTASNSRRLKPKDELREIADLRKRSQILKRGLLVCEHNLDRAFPCEQSEWRKKSSELEEELDKAEQRLTKLELAHVDRLPRAALTAKERFNEEEAFLQRSAEEFPESAIIDLSCLARYLDKRSLPALTLFSPHHTTTLLDVYKMLKPEVSWGAPSNEWLHRPDIGPATAKALALQIMEATGLIVSTDGGRGKANVETILLTCSYGEKGRTIPEEARDIIRRAERSGLYDNVYLLAEALDWKIKYWFYETTSAKPKLEGQVVQQSNSEYDRDPLIIGVKTLPSGRFISVCIGKFDITPIEEHVFAEYVVNP